MTARQLADWRSQGTTFRYRGHDIFYHDELEGAGPYPQVEAPESTFAHFFAFLDRVASPATVSPAQT